jgi:hypothetical protein
MNEWSGVVNEVPQFKRGFVWCCECGRKKRVNAALSLAHGWPKCCGYTMTLDSPEERAAMQQRKVSK